MLLSICTKTKPHNISELHRVSVTRNRNYNLADKSANFDMSSAHSCGNGYPLLHNGTHYHGFLTVKNAHHPSDNQHPLPLTKSVSKL